MLIRVKNGTDAGRRRIVELEPWRCACPAVQPGSRYSCPGCGERRPADHREGS